MWLSLRLGAEKLAHTRICRWLMIQHALTIVQSVALQVWMGGVRNAPTPAAAPPSAASRLGVAFAVPTTHGDQVAGGPVGCNLAA